MTDKPSTFETVLLWMLVILVVVAVVAHATPTGRGFIRQNIPMHGGP